MLQHAMDSKDTDYTNAILYGKFILGTIHQGRKIYIILLQNFSVPGPIFIQSTCKERTFIKIDMFNDKLLKVLCPEVASHNSRSRGSPE